MKMIEFKQKVYIMVDTFGVNSCFENDEDEDLWFECPECGEPILYEDYGDREDMFIGNHFQCPICENILDI